MPQSKLQALFGVPADQGGNLRAGEQTGGSAARNVEQALPSTTPGTRGKELKPAIPLAPLVFILIVLILLSSFLGGGSGLR